jgi:TorA-specific chaperone
MRIATTSCSHYVSESLRRAELYRWFAGLIADRLDPVLLRAYREGPGRDILDNLAKIPALEDGARRIEAALDTEKSDRDLVEALASDFRSLFEKGAANPRASHWLGLESDDASGPDTRSDHQPDILSRMKALLRHSGLGLRPSFPSAPDHLAVLLVVMAQTAEASLAEWRKANPSAASSDRPVCEVEELVQGCRDQKAFIDHNLLSWLPAFRDACTRHDPDGFYAGVSALLVAYLEQDRVFLSDCITQAD